MTAREMSDMIDIRINSYVMQHDYGKQQGDLDITLNEYEKSLYLTKAQKEIVRGSYLGLTVPNNLMGEPFEYSENIRRALAQIVRTTTYYGNDVNNANNWIYNQSYNSSMYDYNVTLKDDVWYIVYEDAVVINKDCVSSKDSNNHQHCNVVPTKHDELYKIINNPFRKPSKNRVLRLDIDYNVVQLVTSYPFYSYEIRYISEPKPIITANLPIDVSIDGCNTYQDCELNTVVHDLIVDYAIQLIAQAKGLGRAEKDDSK